MNDTTDEHFSAAELDTLRAHGIVLFARRVIFDARPPMPPERLAAVQTACAGPLPATLVALWQQTAGGRLDYDLALRMHGNEEAIHWAELFHDNSGSDGGPGLQDWIERERQRAEEAARGSGTAWNGRIAALPIGGFEHSDRIYVVVGPGDTHGQVIAWKQGLPPAWTHELHQDSLGFLAVDLNAAFAALHLDEDPLATTGESPTGQTLLEYLDDRHESHGLDLDLMDRLVAFYRQAVVDWRTPLAEGSLRHHPGLAKVALRHAAVTDDADLVAELAAAGVALDGPLQGSALATDLALEHNAFAATAALVRAGAPVAPDALRRIDEAVSPELTAALLGHGARPDAAGMVNCVACGAPASARLIADACARAGIDVAAAYARERDAALAELEAALVRVRDGDLGHYLGREGLTQRIGHLRDFRL